VTIKKEVFDRPMAQWLERLRPKDLDLVFSASLLDVQH